MMKLILISLIDQEVIDQDRGQGHQLILDLIVVDLIEIDKVIEAEIHVDQDQEVVQENGLGQGNGLDDIEMKGNRVKKDPKDQDLEAKSNCPINNCLTMD